MRLRFVIGSILIAAFSIPAILIAGMLVRYFWLTSHGYHVGIVGWKLAQQIEEQHLPATECSKIDNWPEFMAPSSQEQSGMCYYELAELLKDPTICENLMPSPYGVWCVGDAMGAADDVYHQSYWCNADEDGEHCYHADGSQTLTIDYDQCDQLPNSQVYERDWCYVGRFWHRHDDSACKHVVGSKQRDACDSVQAERTLDDGLCEKVNNLAHRSACHVLVKAFRESPELQTKH